VRGRIATSRSGGGELSTGMGFRGLACTGANSGLSCGSLLLKGEVVGDSPRRSLIPRTMNPRTMR
jgi:hypothetical protein